MISGIVSSELEAILRLRVLGAGGDAEEIDAVIDTGFNGDVTLPAALIENLKLPWFFRQQGELADGSLHVFDVHAATILWHGQPRIVEVEVAETQPLLGMSVLAQHSLRIDVRASGAVSINALTD
jgi:clan AA aspartic protease